MAGGGPKRLFISHGAEATAWAVELTAALAAEDASFIIVTVSDVAAGDGIQTAVREAIQESDAIVLLVAAEPADDERHQWIEVLRAHWKDDTKQLASILLDGASAPPFLRGHASFHAELETPPSEVAGWIASQLEEPPGDDATRPAKVTARPAQPWVDYLRDDIDNRSQLLRRLDATIAALSEERPDEEELRENRKALVQSCEGGQDPKSLALAHLNIGLIDLELRAHETALEHLNRALEICESAAIEGYPNRVSILMPLAETLAEMKNFSDALDAMRRAAEIRAEEDGGESPGVIAIKQELGTLLVRAGNYTEAIDLLTHTLAVNRKQLGPTHTQVEANELWLSLAQEYLHSHDPSAAADSRGVEPLTKVMRLLGLGYTMIEIDNLCGAQAALGRAVGLAEDSQQIPASIRASCWFYNGVALCKSRQWDLAVDELRKAADGNKELEINEGWAASMFYLGTALRSNGETGEAVAILREMLPIAGDVYGERSLEVTDNLYSLGLALRDRGDYEEARDHLDKAVQIGAELAGKDDPRVLKYRRTLSRLDRVAA